MNTRSAAGAAAGLATLLRRHGPAALTAVVAVVLTADVGRLVYRAVRPPPTAAKGVVPPSAPPIADLGAAEGLFGRPPVEIAPGAEAPEVVATDLELTGTIAVEDPGGGFGILRKRGDVEHFYRAGDAIPGGGKLTEIFVDRVTIDTGAGRKTLRLPRAGLGGADLLAALPVRQPRWVELAPEIPKTREERLAHPVNAMNSRLARALRLKPWVVEGHVLGYRLDSFGPHPPIPGLPPKALIREINGVVLTDGEVAGRMIDSLPGSGMATFVIQNGDGERSLTLDVSGLASLVPPNGP